MKACDVFNCLPFSDWLTISCLAVFSVFTGLITNSDRLLVICLTLSDWFPKKFVLWRGEPYPVLILHNPIIK